MNWSDRWDKRAKDQSPPTNRGLGIAMLIASMTLSMVYVGYLLTEASATNCDKWSCIP